MDNNLDPMDQPERPDPDGVVVHAADLAGPISLYIDADIARALGLEVPDGQPEVRRLPVAFSLPADDATAITYFDDQGQVVGWLHLPGGVFTDPPDGGPAVMEVVEVYGERMTRYMHARDGSPCDVDGPAETYVDSDGRLVWTCDTEQHWTYHR